MTLLTRLALLTACLFWLTGCISIPLALPPSDYQEVVIERGRKDKILLLDIDGIITSGPTRSDPLWGDRLSTVNQVVEKLEKAKEDSSIKAIVLRIDSPGGGVTASDVIYKSLLEYKEEQGVPVYCSMLDTAASGGYYIAMASDQVYAHPTTVTGSIGVLAMFPQLKGLGEMIGVHVEVIKSGENKNMGSPFHDMSAEEKSIFQDTIDEMYDRFVEVVRQGRPLMEEEDIRRLADGRIYTARQAKDAGLIDGIMYLSEVVDEVKAKEGLSRASLVMYRKTSEETYDSMYAKAGPAPLRAEGGTAGTSFLTIDAGQLLPSGPAFQYLWLP